MCQIELKKSHNDFSPSHRSKGEDWGRTCDEINMTDSRKMDMTDSRDMMISDCRTLDGRCYALQIKFQVISRDTDIFNFNMCTVDV